MNTRAEKPDKKKRVILIVAVSVTLLTAAAIASAFIYDFAHVADSADVRINAAVYIFLGTPIILEEIALFISAYKLADPGLAKYAKVCNIISIVIASGALAFQILAYTGVLKASHLFPEGPVAASSCFIVLLMITEWIAALSALVLCSMGKAERGGNDEEK